MSAKCLDQQGRWRNKVVAFRCHQRKMNSGNSSPLIRIDETRVYYPEITGKRGCSNWESESVQGIENELAKVLNELKSLKKRRKCVRRFTGSNSVDYSNDGWNER